MNQIQQLFMTSNEVVNNILTYSFPFIEAFVYLILLSSILNIQTTKRQKILFIVTTAIVSIISKLILLNPLSYFVNLLCLFILLRTTFNQNLKNSLIALVILYALTFIIGFSCQEVLILLFNIPYDYIINIPIYRILTYSIIYIGIFLVSLSIKNKNKIKKYIKISFKTTTIINMILGLLSIFIQSYIFSIYEGSFPSDLKIIAILSQLIYFIFSLFSVIRTNKLEKTQQNLEQEILCNKTLSLLYDNIRGFKHDFDNIVQVIGGYISLNDMEGLKTYYKSLLNDCKETNSLDVLNPNSINNPSIYSLLNNKFFAASEKGIKMTFNIFTDLSKINFNIYEFTRILGILLDNAIEAAEETEEKLINVEFRSDNKKQLFIIENSCSTNNISTTKIFEKGYSTKNRNSGFGLWKVHTILAKNTNIDLFTTVNDYMFKQQLEVFY